MVPRYRPILACQTFHSAKRGRKVWELAYSVLVRGIWNYFASRKRNANFMSSFFFFYPQEILFFKLTYFILFFSMHVYV